MGYSKFSFEDYLKHGIALPKWATAIAGMGYKSICAIDFYDDIFGDRLEPHRDPADYRTGEYGGIVIEKIPVASGGYRSRRTTITQGNGELYDLIDRSENFCMTAPISYVGRARTNKNAREMYALVIEIDDIVPKTGINELFYSWRRAVSTMPTPTYIVCSGNGVHLYFVFERPVPLFSTVFEQMTNIKNHLTRYFWNAYVTQSHATEKVQYESINQPFRCVGTATKSGDSYAIAFEVGSKITIDYLNQFVPADKQIKAIYKSDLPLAKAKKLYPNWYQRRIVEGQERGHWNRHDGIYYNWIEKIRSGATVGHRYHCLENLCSLAVQCNISPEQVEKDCRELLIYMEQLTEEENNHFTEHDIICALKTYHYSSEQAYRRRIDIISKKTGISLVRNKRNGQSQADHLEETRMLRDLRCRRRGVKWDDKNGRKKRSSQQKTLVESWCKNYPEGTIGECCKNLNIARSTVQRWWINGDQKKGRPPESGSSKSVVEAWIEEHPDGTKAECIRDTGLSKPTVYKWWGKD